MPFNRESCLKEMLETRRTIHKRPEEGWTEFETTWLVASRLRALGIKTLTGKAVIDEKAVMGRDPKLVAQAIERAEAHGVPAAFIEETGGYTGCVGIIDTGRPGPVTALRCDMDCVLVDESESCEGAAGGFRSERPGFMHACGHDGHTSVGLAVARWLMAVKDEIPLKGVIKLIFQPAEEGVRGAGPIAASGILDDVDHIIGGHIGTFAHLGEVGLCEGGFLASTKLDVHFEGVPSHAGSDPQKGRSALMAACAAAMMMQGIPRHGEGATRISIGRLNAGEGRNVTPVHADMQLEVRGETAEINRYMVECVKRIVEGTEACYDVKGTLVKAGEATTLRRCPAMIDALEEAAKSVPGVTKVFRTSRNSGSEDFTLLLERVCERGGDGAFFLYGCNHHGHHRADFEIQDEQSLPIGFDVFCSIVKKLNG